MYPSQNSDYGKCKICGKSFLKKTFKSVICNNNECKREHYNKRQRDYEACKVKRRKEKVQRQRPQVTERNIYTLQWLPPGRFAKAVNEILRRGRELKYD
jgi:uncharacterized cysteine cluster protein YcgN (CxxCxxCC family)